MPVGDDRAPGVAQTRPAGSVILHARASAGSVEAKDIYFAFPDGGLGYDCGACGAQCCRGHGYYASVEKELPVQLKMRRHLHVFVRPPEHAEAQHRLVCNVVPQCFFLDDSGRCEVQMEHGYSVKPETCRYFPFNNFTLVGRHLVVAAHTSLCPLDILVGREPNALSDHGRLRSELVATGISALVKRVSIQDDAADVAIEQERRIRDSAAALAGSSSFTQALEAQARICSSSEHEATQRIVELALLQRSLEHLLGPDPSLSVGETRQLDDIMIMNASHLRSQLRFPVPDKSSLAPTLAPALIPHALLVLRWIVAAALNSGMRVATHQSLSRMLREFGPLIDLLARASTLQQWRPGAAVDLGASVTPKHRPATIRIAKALLPRTQERRSRPLGDILLEHAPSKVEERIEFLVSLAPRLVRYIQAVGERTESHTTTRTSGED